MRVLNVDMVMFHHTEREGIRVQDIMISPSAREAILSGYASRIPGVQWWEQQQPSQCSS